MAADTRLIMEELKAIREDLGYIKEHMIDVDTLLTPDEEGRLNESLQDLKEGKTTSLEDFEKEMKRNVKSRAR